MKKRIALLPIIMLMFSFCSLTQARDYALHTDANMQRLRQQIENDAQVKTAWDRHYEKAVSLADKGRVGVKDFQVLSLVYRVTGEERFAETIKSSLQRYTSSETWEGSALLNRTPSWTGGLNTSHNCYYISIAYDCIYDYLTPTERKQIAQDFVQVGFRPLYENWLSPEESFQTFDTMGHNWWSACVYMAGLTAVVLRDEIPEAKQWALDIAATAQEWMNYTGSVLQNKPPTFDRNGGFYESVNYANYGCSKYLQFRYAMSRVYPKVEQPELTAIAKMTDFFMATTYFDINGEPISVDFGDSAPSINGGDCAKLLWNLGYQSDDYAWFIKKLNAKSTGREMGFNAPVCLLFNPDLPELDDDYTPEFAKSHIFPDMGWATMRNSWSDSATMLAVKCGFTWNHTHADAGSFILYHKGYPLLIDGGKCSYGNPLYSEYYCQSEAHSVVLFNGEGQDRRDPYYGVTNPGSLHNLIDTEDFKYILANATGPYSHILSRNYRHFIWVGDVILVIDDLLAHEPGQFEWLLHYSGESKRNGLDLSVKQDKAEVLVRPLFPVPFPDGGLPHDFPESMRLEERTGYEDHHPEIEQSYWSMHSPVNTQRTKLITAIILKDDTENLPVVERFEGKDFLGVSITQNGEKTDLYLNLLADGRLKHRNSVITMNGWQTDAYLMALTYPEGKDSTSFSELEDVFVGHGSYIRRDGKVLMHALSKYTAHVADLNTTPELQFDGQANAIFYLYSPKKFSKFLVNNEYIESTYNASKSLVRVICE